MRTTQLDFQITVVAVKFVFFNKIDTVGTIGQKAITLRLYGCGSNKIKGSRQAESSENSQRDQTDRREREKKCLDSNSRPLKGWPLCSKRDRRSFDSNPPTT